MLQDHNLLQIFAALWTAKSASRAGKILGLGQPAMSARLSRLRETFQDPLFVRHARGLVPTPRAIALAPRVLAALKSCEEAFALPGTFEPAKAEATVTIGGTDYFDLMAMPFLIPRLASAAPGVKVITKTVRGELPKEMLENGSLDLAVAGFFKDLPEGFYRQKLFDETYACVVRRDHPRIQNALTKKLYLEQPHLLISPGGDLHGVVDQVLEKQRVQRRVVAGIGNFHAPGPIIAQSDLILTAPRRLVEAYATYLPLKVFEPPFAIPGFAIMQIWHERTHKDPLRHWIRELIQRGVASK